MSIIAVGAIAAALAVSCAVFAPFARVESATVRAAHPDRHALDDANWHRPIWHWESLRASCILGGALLSLATPLPPVVLIAAAGLAPSPERPYSALVGLWRRCHGRSSSVMAVPAVLAAVRAAL